MELGPANTNQSIRLQRENVRNVKASLEKLSSGSRTVSGGDAGGLVVSSKFDTQTSRIDSVRTNIANSLSEAQTADGYLKQVTKTLSRMGELASLAMDGTKSATDKQNYNQEFQDLKAYIRDVATKTMNGHNLFDGSEQNVIKDSNGNFYSYTNANLQGTDFTDLTTGTVTNAELQWETSIDLYKVSVSGVTLDQAAYKLNEDSYEVLSTGVTINRLKKDLWYDGGNTESAWSATDNGGTKYTKHSFVKMGTGSGSQDIQYMPYWRTGLGTSWAEEITAGTPYICTANPLAAPLGNLENGDVTFKAAGSFTQANPNNNSIDPPSVSAYSAGTFIAGDPGLGSGQTAVAAGDYISVNPASEDTGATYYAAGSIVSSDPTSVDGSATEVSYSHILTNTGASTVIGKVTTALNQLADDRAAIGAASSRMQRMNEQMSMLRESLNRSVSRLRDTDVAAESTRFAKHQILVNSSSEMLDKARIVNEQAFKLLLSL